MVISTSFGVGEIVGFEHISGSKEEFIVIKSRANKIKVMVPMDKLGTIRKLSTPIEMNKSLERLGNKRKQSKFDNSKDRLAHYKSKSQDQCINNLIETITDLSELSDRGAAENNILKSLLDSLSLEMEIVLNIANEPARAMIKNSLDNQE